MAGLLALFIACGMCSAGSALVPDDHPLQVAVQRSEMIVQGPVGLRLLARVEAVLNAPHDPIETVLLASSGGMENEAESIRKALSDMDVRRVVVPAHFACESACLLIALAAPDFEPADSARLMFHRGWIRRGPDSCAACSAANWLENLSRDVLGGPNWHREMRGWANRLAPGLGNTLAACRPNPFDTLQGITIDGQAFKRFKAGDNAAIRCRSAR